MPASSYALIVRPDPHSPGRYVALCPDIPGWSATGDTPAEAGAIGSEIVRGIISERRSSGTEVPVVRTHTVQVTVAEPAAEPATPLTAPATAPVTPLNSPSIASASKPKPVVALHESDGFQALASVVARSREQQRSAPSDEDLDAAVDIAAGRILKSERIAPR